MPATIRHRPFSSDERARLAFSWPARLSKHLAANFGRFLIYFLLTYLALVVLAGIVDRIVYDHIGRAIRVTPDKRWIVIVFGIAFWGFAIGLPAYFAIRRFRRRSAVDRERIRDRDRGEVDMIHVLKPAYALALEPGKALLYLFDLDNSKTLVIDHQKSGDWYHLCDISPPSLDEDENITQMDGEDGYDFPFPNTECIVHRLAHSGDLLRIEIKGEALPLSSAYPLRALSSPELQRFIECDTRMSIVIDRSLSSLLSGASSETFVAF
jgi:hypothetical protein